jgi:hypothetical protein
MAVVICLNRFLAPVDETVTAQLQSQVTSHKSQVTSHLVTPDGQKIRMIFGEATTYGVCLYGVIWYITFCPGCPRTPARASESNCPTGISYRFGLVCVCVYYCRTYYKAVRGGGEEESGRHVL